MLLSRKRCRRIVHTGHRVDPDREELLHESVVIAIEAKVRRRRVN